MLRNLSLTNSFFILFALLCVSCPDPIATFTFPALPCPEDMLNIRATAKVIGAAGSQPILRIEVCVDCGGTAITGATVVGRVKDDGTFEVPDILRGDFTFDPTNAAGTGCTQRDISLTGLPTLFPAGNLVGKQFVIEIKDTAGLTKTETVTIE